MTNFEPSLEVQQVQAEQEAKLKETIEDKDLDVKKFGRFIKRRLRNNWDIVMAVCGEEGSGKSVLDIKLGQAIDPNFTLKDNLLFNPDVEDMKRKISNMDKYSYIGSDEVMKVLYKLLWSSRGAIFLNVLYSLVRKENKATGLCIPNFQDLNRYFRQHRVRLWAEVIERGTAVVFMKDWSPSAKDKWWLDEMQKTIDMNRRRKSVLSFTLEDKLKALRNTRNYVTTIRFGDLTQEEKTEYENLRSQQKYESSDTLQEGGTMLSRVMAQRNKAIMVLKEKGMLHVEIARALQCPDRTINTIIAKETLDNGTSRRQSL